MFTSYAWFDSPPSYCFYLSVRMSVQWVDRTGWSFDNERALTTRHSARNLGRGFRDRSHMYARHPSAAGLEAYHATEWRQGILSDRFS